MAERADVLRAALAGVLPAGAAVAWSDPRLHYPLREGEVLPGAVPARLAEFSAGRYAARQAMVAFGQTPQAIPQGRDRAPIWPAGIFGSITHGPQDCLAVIAGTSVGIDLEPATELPTALWPIVLRPEEAEYVTDGVTAKIIFCVKEAVYKAQYPHSKKLFDFQAIEVMLSEREFTAVFHINAAPFQIGDEIRGHVIEAQDVILAVAMVN